MLTASQRDERLKHYAAAEASFRLEGMDPSGLPDYEEAKAAVLAGEMTPEEALSFIVKRCKDAVAKKKASSVAA